MSNLAYKLEQEGWVECVELVDGSFMEKKKYEKLKNIDENIITIEDYAESLGFKKCVGDSFITYDQLEEIKWHINKTHTIKDKSIIFNSIKEEQRKQEGFKVKELNDNKIVELVNKSFTDDYNVYMSQNTFLSTWRRNKEWVYRSEVMILDIDYYNIKKYKDFTPEEMYNEMTKKGFEGFHPSYVMSSGRGLYLVYLLEGIPLYKFNRNKALWEKVADALVKKFEKYGADHKAKDICRVNRVPYSINKKTKRQAKILFFNEIKDKQLKRYNLGDLANELLPKKEIQKKKRTVKKEKKKISKITKFNDKKDKTYSTLARARKYDFEKLLVLRKYDIEGYRNIFFHLYSLVAFDIYKNYNEIKELISMLNNRLVSPLNAYEIDKIVNSSFRSYKLKVAEENGYYSYSNEKIIELLNIQRDEMKKFKTIIDKEEKNERQKEKRKAERRNGNGLTKKEQRRKDNLKAIKELLNKDYKQREIAEELGLGKSTVSEYVKEIKALLK